MSEITKYEEQKKKLDGLCEEHDLTYRVRNDRYPITLTIRPIQGAGEQLSLLEQTEGDNYISPDAYMTWIYSDGELTSRVGGGTFTISKVLRSKLENIFLKMVAYWTQYFFRDVIENKSLRAGTMPYDKDLGTNEAGNDEFEDDNYEYDVADEPAENEEVES